MYPNILGSLRVESIGQGLRSESGPGLGSASP